jgi:predicted ArsR family transcriptional regulator
MTGTSRGTDARRTKARKTSARKRKGTRTKLDESKLKKFLDGRLIYAISHVVRAHVLAVLNEKIASPNELANEIGVDVNYISYHFEKLEEIEFIELVRTEPRRGFDEHFYRAKETIFLSSGEIEQLPLSFRVGTSSYWLKSIMVDAISALEAGTFDARNDRHLSWTPLRVDERGWSEASRTLDEALNRLLEIQQESAQRMAKLGEQAVPITVGITAFEMPGKTQP